MVPTGVDLIGAVGRGGGGGGVAVGLGGGGGVAAETAGVGVGVGDGAATGSGFGGAAAAAAAGLPLTAPGLILNNSWPALTVSPSCTKIASITPETGVGTPTVVLSVSISITF